MIITTTRLNFLVVGLGSVLPVILTVWVPVGVDLVFFSNDVPVSVGNNTTLFILLARQNTFCVVTFLLIIIGNC